MCISILGACVVAAHLTNVGIDHIQDTMPTTAHSYDGYARDVSQFYKSEREEFTIGGKVYFDSGTVFSLNYDNGYDSAKLDISRSAIIGVQQAIKLNNTSKKSGKSGTGWNMVVGVETKVGGDTKHSSCVDEFEREYYCGNLTAWSDFKQPKQDDYHMGKLSLTYKF